MPALAAAVIGGLRSFPLAMLGGMLIGAIQAEFGYYFATPGLGDAVPFAAIILLLVLRGARLPLRSFVHERLPRVASGRFNWRVAVPAIVTAAVICEWGLSSVWLLAVTTTLCAAIVLGSLVIVTGYAGQISLAQFTIAGAGALVAAHCIAAGLPTILGILIGVAAAVPLGVVIGFPAGRTRGMSLAIATLGLAVTLHSLVLTNASLVGGYDGLTLGSPTLFGFDIDPTIYPQRFAIVCLLAFVLVAVVLANIRRSRVGRRMLAMRNNERAAAALGINVTATKLVAFAYAAPIAALGGILIVLQTTVATFSNFDVFSSVQDVAWAVIGGVGFLGGPLIGATLQPGAIGTQVVDTFVSGADNYVALVGGLLLLYTLPCSPDGLIPMNAETGKRIWKAVTRRRKPPVRRELPLAAEAPVSQKRSAVLGGDQHPGPAGRRARRRRRLVHRPLG